MKTFLSRVLIPYYKTLFRLPCKRTVAFIVTDMETLSTTYNADEQAWESPEVTLSRNIWLTVSLKEKGKLVIRQQDATGNWPLIPLGRQEDTKDFCLRMTVCPEQVKIKLFTSTEPKEIKYAYI